MAAFKIRDLMVALRPGVPTPDRPDALDVAACAGGVSECQNAPFASGCDASGCGPSCDPSGCDPSCDPSGCDPSGCDPSDCNPSACDPSGVGGGCPPCSYCSGFCTGCNTATCRTISGCGISLGCGLDNCTRTRPDPFAGCGLTCEACSGTPRPYAIAQMSAGQLAILKNQLRATMKQVASREQELAAAAERRAMVPRTVEQVDALEKKLSEALEELRARRAELQKPAEPKNKEIEKEGDKGKRGGKGK